MDVYSLIICAAVAVSVYELTAIIRTRKKILIRGRMPLARLACGIFLAAAAAGLAYWNYVRGEAAFYYAFLLITGTYAVIPVGLGQTAMYRNGMASAYRQFEYFMIIREFKSGFTLRIHRRDEKDYIILFKKEQMNNVLKLLADNGVADWDSFVFPSDRTQ